MIKVRFNRVVVASNKDADVFVAFFNMPQVPEEGETISVLGHPYLIASRGWAVGDEGTFAYLRIVPMSPLP